jgi:hypothetical protein
MKFELKTYNNLTAQLCYDEENVWVEISDLDNNALGEIRRSKDGKYDLIIYKTAENISLPVEDILKYIEFAKKNIYDVT